VPTGIETPADAQLIRQLARRGIHVTVRQLQEWRRLGILDSPRTIYHGRLGTEADEYPEGSEDRVATIVRVLKKYRQMYVVVLGLFGLGVNPTERALRGAYRKLFDISERDDRKSHTIVESGDFGPRMDDISESLRKAVPGAMERWTADARERAREERMEEDVATGKKPRVTSKDIKIRDTYGWLSARLGESGADDAPFLRALGYEELPETVELVGEGGPSYAELRDALDAAEYKDLIRLRDQLLASRQEFISEALPEWLRPFVEQHVEEPETFGMAIAGGVVSAFAFKARWEAKQAED
jgi:hypothetical protein